MKMKSDNNYKYFHNVNLEALKIFDHNSIKEALQALDINGRGTLFVLDEKGILQGIVTDGDIRRSLLKGVNINDRVCDVMNTSFVCLSVDADNNEILASLSKKIKLIPLIDKDSKLVDYASIDRLHNISISSPLLEGNELKYITECIHTNWISSQGKFVRGFESLFEQYHSGYKALAVSNGTVALHLALAALGIGKGDEVIVPDLTFAASVNAIIYTGATPVLVDVEMDSWNVSVDKIKKAISSKTKAIMPVHLYGLPCNMEEIAAIAKEYKLFVVEDCAEALGSTFIGRPVGTFGDAATFSFFGNKTITTGEGGMILFKDKVIAERAAMLRDHGMNKNRRYWHDEVGYNYRLTNIQAAIGVAQFERLEEFVRRKRNTASIYNFRLGKYSFLRLPISNDEFYNSFWLYTLLVNEDAPFNRGDLMDFLKHRAVETRPVFFPLHSMPPYIDYGKSSELYNSIQISNTGMSLPSAVSLSEREAYYICDCIDQFVQNYI
jgi:perosamine synthetase